MPHSCMYMKTLVKVLMLHIQRYFQDSDRLFYLLYDLKLWLPYAPCTSSLTSASSDALSRQPPFSPKAQGNLVNIFLA